MFTGKWAFTWHDMTWGPFDTKEEAEHVVERIGKHPRAPQQSNVFPLWDTSFIEEIARGYDRQ